MGEKPFEGFAPTGPAPTTPSPLTTTYSPRHKTDGCFSAANPPGITKEQRRVIARKVGQEDETSPQAVIGMVSYRAPGPKWTAFLSHGWDDSRRFFCIFSNFLAVDDQ